MDISGRDHEVSGREAASSVKRVKQLTRKDFIKMAGTGVGGLLVLPSCGGGGESGSNDLLMSFG
jgi:hypothetical protein